MPTTADTSSILLLGAGELGRALLPHISSLPNTRVTIGVRSVQDYAHLQSSNTSLVAIDLTAPSAQLIPLFAQYPIIIAATGFSSAPGSVTKLAREVLEAGTLRKEKGRGEVWFFPWQWGVDYDVTRDGNGVMPLFGEQAHVRGMLRSQAAGSGVKWTVVSVGIFMSFLFEPGWGVVVQRSSAGISEQGEHAGTKAVRRVSLRCLRDWEHRITVTDVHDIGRVLRRILTRDVEAGNRVVYVAGDTVTYAQLADLVERVAGCHVVREVWSVEHLQRELSQDPDDAIKRYRLVFAGDGVWWEKERSVNHTLGMQMTDVETYAKKMFRV